MKKGLNTSSKLLAALFMLLVVTGNWSCKKKDSTCYALITVTDSGGASVADANVHVHAQSVSGDVEATATTDGSGQASFSFKLQAIFNVDVTKGALLGAGIIKLEPGQTIEKTIIIQ